MMICNKCHRDIPEQASYTWYNHGVYDGPLMSSDPEDYPDGITICGVCEGHYSPCTMPGPSGPCGNIDIVFTFGSIHACRTCFAKPAVKEICRVALVTAGTDETTFAAWASPGHPQPPREDPDYVE